MDFVRTVLLTAPPVFISSAGRRYTSHIGFQIPGTVWSKGLTLRMEDLGYKSYSSKVSRLSKYYLNLPALESCREKLVNRRGRKMDFTSVALPTIAGDKDSRSQGHCMLAIVATMIQPRARDNPKLEVSVLYRITEVVKKFGADLIFLHQEVIPRLIPKDWEISAVNFHFTNAYFSPLFMPILYQYQDPVDLLEELLQHIDSRDPRQYALFKSCCRAVALPLLQSDPNHYNYRARRLMHMVAQEALANGWVDAQRVHDFLSTHNLSFNVNSPQEDIDESEED